MQGQLLSLQGNHLENAARLLDKLKLLLGCLLFITNYEYCCVRGNCFTKEKYKLTIAFKYVGSERYSYRFWVRFVSPKNLETFEVTNMYDTNSMALVKSRT